MATIHFTMQGKGGVGKSFVSSLLAQWHRGQNRSVLCVDTDPVNATFSQYRALEVQRLVLCDDGSTRVSERAFDKLMVMILESSRDFVIDSGASSFLPLSNYLLENEAISMLQEAERAVVIHPVVTGGHGFNETLTGLQSLLDQFGEVSEVVVWLNHFFGTVEAEGKTFEQMKIYQKHRDRITGLIQLPRLNPDTYGKDAERMLQAKLTFDEALGSPDFNVMERQRLKVVKRAVFEQLDLVLEPSALAVNE